MSIDVERDGGVATITVNRPDALNALDLEHLRELHGRLDELARGDDARVVVLTGAGERAFVAGADIKYMSGLSVLEGREWGGLGHATAELLETMPKPTIAAINGFALGGGCALALAWAKEATNLALQGGHAANLAQEAALFAMAFSTEDQKEGMSAFVEKR